MRKVIIILVVVVLAASASVSASSTDQPSVFEISVVNSFKLAHVAAADFTAYTPALRMQFNITTWFGLSAEGMYRYPVGAETNHIFNLATDLVVRLPLGFFEPSLALGPNYIMTLANDNTFTFVNKVAYEARIGFDFNITDWFTVALEGKLLVSDVPTFIANLTSVDGPWFMENTFVGIVLKAKL